MIPHQPLIETSCTMRVFTVASTFGEPLHTGVLVADSGILPAHKELKEVCAALFVRVSSKL